MWTEAEAEALREMASLGISKSEAARRPPGAPFSDDLCQIAARRPEVDAAAEAIL
jgi:hypothetical protein